MARILVALDDSDGSARAAEFVQSFFGPLDVEVVALSVARRAVPWIPAGTSYGLTYPWAGAMSHGVTVDRLAQAEHERAERAVATSDLDADASVVEWGDVAEVIARVAEEHDVDLVVVGSNDKSFFERLLTGSVSRRLASDLPRPVLLVGG